MFHAQWLMTDAQFTTLTGLLENDPLQMLNGIPWFIESFPEELKESIRNKYQQFTEELDQAQTPSAARQLLYAHTKEQNTRSLSQLPDHFIAGKTFLVRVDYNDIHEPFPDDIRLNASLETIRHILDRKGKIVILAHRGRPKSIVIKTKMGLYP